MNTLEKCPRCGSGPHGGTSWYSRYECRTILWDDGTLRVESRQCKINQLTLIAECLAADLRAVNPTAESLAAYDRIKP